MVKKVIALIGAIVFTAALTVSAVPVAGGTDSEALYHILSPFAGQITPLSAPAAPGTVNRLLSATSPTDPYYATYQKAYFDYMHIPEGWDIAKGSDTIIVAVVDSGVDAAHPDLVGRVLSTGYNFVGNNTNTADDNGHGTSVAGIIAANVNNAVGVSGATAGCKILPVKVMDAAGNGIDSNVAAGIRYAADNGARVINLSLGRAGQSSDVTDAVDYAYSKGCVLVGGSGNDGTNDPYYPGACPNALSVGSVSSTGTLSTFSNYGSALDLCAVGESIASTWYNGGVHKYSLSSGTSDATPFVAALAALLFSLDSSYSADQVKAFITSTATDLGTTGSDQYYGSGVINYYAALSAAQGGTGGSGSGSGTGGSSGVLNADATPPVITLTGNAQMTVALGAKFNDPGATAVDAVDGDLTSKIKVSGTVNTAKAGTYTVTYTVSDKSGNNATASRTVTVSTATKPTLQLIGDSSIKIKYKSVYKDAGATAFSKTDGDLTAKITVTSTVNTAVSGSYKVTYSVTDSIGYTVTAVRTVTVQPNALPIIKLIGTPTVTVAYKSTYKDAGAVALDAEDGDLTAKLKITSVAVDTSRPGTQYVVFSITDSAGVTVTVTRKVIVNANKPPVITLNNAKYTSVPVGGTYTEYGAKATDVEDGDLTAAITVTGTVNTAAKGTYIITYTVTDSAQSRIVLYRTIVVR